MGLDIYWTEFAFREFRIIFDYHRKKAGVEVATKLVSGIYNETLKLRSHPEIGQVEELLKVRNQVFRYLVFKNYKIIYWLNSKEDRVEIIDVFDTRRNPQRIKSIK